MKRSWRNGVDSLDCYMANYSLPLKLPTLAVEPIIPAFYSLSYENNYTESYKRLRGYI